MPCAYVCAEPVDTKLGAKHNLQVEYFREREEGFPTVVHTLGGRFATLVETALSRKGADWHPLESAFLQLVDPSAGIPGGPTVTQAAIVPHPRTSYLDG